MFVAVLRSMIRGRALRGSHVLKTGHTSARAWGAIAIAAICLVPLAALAFSGQTGSGQVSYTGATTVDAFATTTFTAPQTVTCMVTVDLTTSTQSVNSTPTGIQVMWPLAAVGGVNQYGGQGSYVSAAILSGYFTAHATRLFTVNSGQTAQFGCHIQSSGDFSDSRVSGNCVTTYVCQ
jgi:hypothetical protein